MGDFKVAKVSTQVNCNFQAWAKIVSTHETKEAAEKAARVLYSEMEMELRERDDFGNGAIMSDDIMIFDERWEPV